MTHADSIRRSIRRFFVRTQPYGLVSLRYLLPRLSPDQRVHRRLLARGLPDRPRAVAWIADLWLWIRWVGFDAWRATSNAVRRHGARARERSGLSERRQRYEMLWLALIHGIAPLAYYQFEFHSAARRLDMWRYVYDSETTAFHRLRDEDGDATRGRAFLSDKHRSAEHFAAMGIAVAETTAVVARGSTHEDLPYTGTDLRFCKPRSGSRSRGVFRYRRDLHGLTVWTIGGREVSPDQALDFVDQRLRRGEAVVQPYYPTHPALEHLGAAADEAITVRIITERGPQNSRSRPIDVYCAWLEVPVRSATSQGSTARGYCPLIIESGSGAIGEPAGPNLFGHAPVIDELAASAHGLVVPGWRQLVDAAMTVHGAVDGVFAIAWDFVIADEGPVLLEGNTGWGATVPQQICGPLLAGTVGQ